MRLAVGCTELAKGNSAAAVVSLRKAVEKGPFFLNHYMLATAYLEAGRQGEAVTQREELMIGCGAGSAFYSIWSVKAHYLLGLAYEKSGWNEKAIERYEEFLDIGKNADPGLTEVDDARARLARLKTGS